MSKIKFKHVFITVWLTVALAHFGSAYFFKWFIREERLNSVERIHVKVESFESEMIDGEFLITDTAIINSIRKALISGDFIPAPNGSLHSTARLAMTMVQVDATFKLRYYMRDQGPGRCWYSNGGWNLGAYDDTLLAPILLPLVKAHCNRDSLQ